MTRIEKTNAKISQKYASTLAAEALTDLIQLITLKGTVAPWFVHRLEADASEAQRCARVHSGYARTVLCNAVNGVRS